MILLLQSLTAFCIFQNTFASPSPIVLHQQLAQLYYSMAQWLGRDPTFLIDSITTLSDKFSPVKLISLMQDDPLQGIL